MENPDCIQLFSVLSPSPFFFSVGQNEDVSACLCPALTVKSRHDSVLRHNDSGNI